MSEERGKTDVCGTAVSNGLSVQKNSEELSNNLFEGIIPERTWTD
jgi:hypothetical protein